MSSKRSDGNGLSKEPKVQGGQGSEQEWSKVLWRKQPFPDNHVPPSFLSELKHIPPRARPSIVLLLLAALPITQHLAVIALFLAVFHGLLVGHFGAGQVGWTCCIVGILGWWVYRWGWARIQWQGSGQESLLPPVTPLRSILLPPLLLSLLAPVLGTLTSATTSDSIWPLAGGLFFVHLLLADFTTGKDARLRRREKRIREARKRRNSISQHDELYVEDKSLVSSLSLTSALSASVVLASRLPSTSHVFSLVLLAVGLFAGWPRIAKGVRESGKRFSIALTVSMISLAISLFPESPSRSDTSIPLPALPTIVFSVSIALANVLGPLLLWWSWKWKTQRGGGWDPAVVRLRRKELS